MVTARTEQLDRLEEQLNAGFLVSQYWEKDGVYHFALPALEYSNYIISIPDSPAVRRFVESPSFQRALMHPLNVGVVLLDLVGFSTNPDDTQLKMIVLCGG